MVFITNAGSPLVQMNSKGKMNCLASKAGSPTGQNSLLHVMEQEKTVINAQQGAADLWFLQNTLCFFPLLLP